MNFPTRSAAALAAVTAMFVAAPVAFADDSSDGAGSVAAGQGCGYSGTTVFAPWGDGRSYSLTPDRGFENGAAGWTLEDGAAVAEGNERFQVGGAADHLSLALPEGSSATTPAFCISKREDTFRLFARTNGGDDARMKVEVVYTNAMGQTASVRIDKLQANRRWDATDRLGIDLPQAAGRQFTANVSLRFTPMRGGDWQVDDLYIDPRLRN
jgi:hypothetical protein